MDPLVLICAALREAEPLLGRLGASRKVEVPGRAAYGGSLAGREVVCVIGGMGKTNAAISLTLAAQRWPRAPVIAFGIGGAYPHAGLSVGDIAVATSEHYGDEGVTTPSWWMSCEGIGIPLFEREPHRHFNDIPLNTELAAWAARQLQGVPTGAFVTVSCCSGTSAAGEQLARRFGALCETMEGAAYAHTARHFDMLFIELRGISNLVEDRDLSRWRIDDAADTAARAVELLVGKWEEAPAGNS